MNPLNSQTALNQQQTQYFIATGMGPTLTTSTSVPNSSSLLKNSSSVTQPLMQQQTHNSTGPIQMTTATLMDPNKYITTTQNYVPVLLTNQTLISTVVDPLLQQQQQQQQHQTQQQLQKYTNANSAVLNINNASNQAANVGTMLAASTAAPLHTIATSAANVVSSLMTGPATANGLPKQLIMTTNNPSNISYQVIPHQATAHANQQIVCPTSSSSNLGSVITNPDGSMSLLLAAGNSGTLATSGKTNIE